MVDQPAHRSYRRGYRRLIPALLLCAVSLGCANTPTKPLEIPKRATGQTDTIEELYADGTLRMRKHVVRSESDVAVSHGKYTRWYPNGKKEYEASFRFGRKTGKAISYHSNGKKWMIEHYKDGVRHGKFITYDAAGNRRRVEDYRKGKKDGTWRIWDAAGTVEWEARFENGVMIEENSLSNQ